MSEASAPLAQRPGDRDPERGGWIDRLMAVPEP